MPFSLMESWSCVSRGKGLVSDEMVPPSSSLGGVRSKNGPASWDSGTPPTTSSFGYDFMVPAHSTAAMGFQELTARQFPYGDIVTDRLDGAKGTGPDFGALGSFPGVNGSGSNFEYPVVPGDCQDSLRIDLKLGRFLPDIMDSGNPKATQGIPNFSSPESSAPQKRTRSGGFNLQVAYCQVYGCNKDLSSSKGYHKRHKICDVHSKTPRVIVNGIEQRFCQQCSRFHLLSEFDDTKRSCRKRLAGHNERRRKPQVNIQAGRIGRLLQPYGGPAGNIFRPNPSRSSSLICPDIIFSGGLLNSDQSGATNFPGCVKVENGNTFGPLPAVPLSKGHLDSKPHYTFDGPFNFFHESTTSGIFADNDQSQRDQGRGNSISHSSFREASIGAEDFTIFDAAASTIQALSGISESSCALSLLSSQSRSSSSHSSGIPMAQPLIASSSIASHSSIRGLSNKASFMKPGENSENSVQIPHPVNFGFPDGALQGQDPTINLLQLSTQLQRVNNQRQFI